MRSPAPPTTTTAGAEDGVAAEVVCAARGVALGEGKTGWGALGRAILNAGGIDVRAILEAELGPDAVDTQDLRLLPAAFCAREVAGDLQSAEGWQDLGSALTRLDENGAGPEAVAIANLELPASSRLADAPPLALTSCWVRALRNDAWHPSVWFNLGITINRSHWAGLAREAIAFARAELPDTIELRDQPPLAIAQCFLQSIAIAPDPDAWAGLGVLLNEMPATDELDDLIHDQVDWVGGEHSWLAAYARALALGDQHERIAKNLAEAAADDSPSGRAARSQIAWGLGVSAEIEADMLRAAIAIMLAVLDPKSAFGWAWLADNLPWLIFRPGLSAAAFRTLAAAHPELAAPKVTDISNGTLRQNVPLDQSELDGLTLAFWVLGEHLRRSKSLAPFARLAALLEAAHRQALRPPEVLAPTGDKLLDGVLSAVVALAQRTTDRRAIERCIVLMRCEIALLALEIAGVDREALVALPLDLLPPEQLQQLATLAEQRTAIDWIYAMKAVVNAPGDASRAVAALDEMLKTKPPEPEPTLWFFAPSPESIARAERWRSMLLAGFAWWEKWPAAVPVSAHAELRQRLQSSGFGESAEAIAQRIIADADRRRQRLKVLVRDLSPLANQVRSAKIDLRATARAMADASRLAEQENADEIELIALVQRTIEALLERMIPKDSGDPSLPEAIRGELALADWAARNAPDGDHRAAIVFLAVAVEKLLWEKLSKLAGRVQKLLQKNEAARSWISSADDPLARAAKTLQTFISIGGPTLGACARLFTTLRELQPNASAPIAFHKEVAQLPEALLDTQLAKDLTTLAEHRNASAHARSKPIDKETYQRIVAPWIDDEGWLRRLGGAPRSRE